MNYRIYNNPTQLKPYKRYKTYQLYASVDNAKLPADDAFLICILETVKWVRRRFKNSDGIIEELKLPEPEDYKNISLKDLRGFRFESGFTMDVVYIEDEKIWAYYLMEPDNGVGLDDSTSANRLFETNVGFRIIGDKTHMGVQILCSEPADASKDCQVLRPMVVKNIILNPLLGLREIEPLVNNFVYVEKKRDYSILANLIRDPKRQLPVLIITEPPKDNLSNKNNPDKKKIDKLIKSISDNVISSNQYNTSSFFPRDPIIPINPANIAAEKPIVINAQNIAEFLFGYAYLYRLNHIYTETLAKGFNIKFGRGDVLIFTEGTKLEAIPYIETIANTTAFEDKLIGDLREYPKRREISFGNLLFNSDAKLFEINKRRETSQSASDKLDDMQKTLDEYKLKNKRYEEMNLDKEHIVEENRQIRKEIQQYIKKIKKCEAEQSQLTEELKTAKKKQSFVQEKVTFMRNRVSLAELFPTRKEDVEKWVAQHFSENVILHKRAVSELLKYGGALKLEIICDGIVYLDAYARWRKNQISDHELELYAGMNNWEYCLNSGQTLQQFPNDYSIKLSENSSVSLMDLHIKYGVDPRHLIRIYYLWDKQLGKVVIGSMPKHLPTSGGY